MHIPHFKGLLAILLAAGLSGFDLPPKNMEVLKYAAQNGRRISPTYQKAVCTELVIGILKKFIPLSETDKQRIRIISPKSVQELRAEKSPLLKGVVYALTMNGRGEEIKKSDDVRPGDFVQFWTSTWGHCGLVKELDEEGKRMDLYSSYPSTNGFGIQSFEIPSECYFVRLK